MSESVCICSSQLPFRIQPSLVNQVRYLNQTTYFIHTSDGQTSKVRMEIDSGDISVLSTVQCIDAASLEDPSISAVLYSTLVVITTEKGDFAFSLDYPASWVYISPYQEESKESIVLVFCATTIWTYKVKEGGVVEQCSSLSVNSRVSMFDFRDNILAVAMIDGLVQLWSFEEDVWKLMGTQQVLTSRITDINIQNYPLVVITAWDGSIFFKEWGTLELNTVPLAANESRCGDCCGSFVAYSPGLHVFAISRAVENELLLFDDSMRNMLMQIKFPDFFRGLIMSPNPNYSLISCFAHHTLYAFFVPPVEQLRHKSIRMSLRSDESTTRNLICRNLLSVHRIPEEGSFTAGEHTIQFESEGKQNTFFLEPLILTVCRICGGYVALGLTDSVVAFDIRNCSIVSKVLLHNESYFQMQLTSSTPGVIDILAFRVTKSREVLCEQGKLEYQISSGLKFISFSGMKLSV